MILIIGGFAAGKRTYVKEAYGYTDDDMADGVLNDKPVIFNLQDLVKDDRAGAQALIPALCQKEVVICNEVGSGIVPMTKEDRNMREATGRLCILLAKEAQRVVRIVCGLPVVLKG